MKISKITNGEFEKNSISSLPIRPNESSRYGKAALSGEELKNMFDKNTELLKNRINSIIDYISGEGENGIASEISTGLPDMPTLSELCKSILDGSFAATLTLTEEYTLLDFATKLMHFVSPEEAVEFVKIEKKDGAYTLPERPYENKEHAIYLLPSSDSLSIFDCYIWQDGWKIWSTGSLQNYIGTLESKLKELYDTAARISDVNYIKSVKADASDVIMLQKKIDAMCAGTPAVYEGSFEELQNSPSIKQDRIYLLYGDNVYSGYWCYFANGLWKIGGKYLADTGVTTEIQKYDNRPIAAGAVKDYIDKTIDEAFDEIGRNYSGSLNLFDKTAICSGYIGDNGEIVSSDKYITTDYLDITALYDVCICCTDNAGYRVGFSPKGYMFYNYNKSPIIGTLKFMHDAHYPNLISIDRTKYLNARKMRVIFDKEEYNSVTQVMVAPGENVKQYKPYTRYMPKIDSNMKPDSELPVTNAAICNYVEGKTHSVKWVFGERAAYPVFDTQNNKLIFNRDGDECEWGVILDGMHYCFESGKALSIDISPAATPDEYGNESNHGIIYLNTALMKSHSTHTQNNFEDCFFVRNVNFESDDKNALPIATFKRGEDGFCAWIDCPFFIDGKLFGVCSDDNEIQAKFENVQSALTDMQTEIAENSSYVSELTEKYNAIESDVSAQAITSTELVNTVNELDTKVGGFGTEIEEAKSAALDAKNSVDNLSNAYYTYTYPSKLHMRNGSYLWITNIKMLASFEKYDYSSYSNEYAATVQLSEEVMYNDMIDLTLYFPSCSENPAVYIYDAYSSDLNIKCSGDDCANGVFSPQANTEYTIKIWYQRNKYRAHVIALRV